MQPTIDSDWFKTKLEDNNMSMRDLAKRLDMNISSLSRTFSGDRRMQMDEAKQIAHFLQAPVQEVMRHAGVAVDLDGVPTRIMLVAYIDDHGMLNRLKEPRTLPQSVIDRAHAACANAGTNSRILAAQIRATEGPLCMFDDAVVLFKHTEIMEPAAVGSMTIGRDSQGRAGIGRILKARKTGEATVMSIHGKPQELEIVAATPVIAIIP